MADITTSQSELLLNTRELVPAEPEVITVAYGGGLNSTGVLVGMKENGIAPHVILFADTGGERPELYRYVQTVSEWCVANGFPAITTVQRVDRHGDPLTLEADCLRRSALPALAYGFKTCSQKFKAQPQEKFINNWEPAIQEWKAGRRVIKVIGYDYGEMRRVKFTEDAKFVFWYPLIEWKWDRAACAAAIQRAGLPPAAKSSCFFCPANTVPELIQLQSDHPDLMRRALEMEANADLVTVRGLGRRFNWAVKLVQIAEATARSEELPPSDPQMEIPCDCFDGGSDDL